MFIFNLIFLKLKHSYFRTFLLCILIYFQFLYFQLCFIFHILIVNCCSFCFKTHADCYIYNIYVCSFLFLFFFIFQPLIYIVCSFLLIFLSILIHWYHCSFSIFISQKSVLSECMQWIVVVRDIFSFLRLQNGFKFTKTNHIFYFHVIFVLT